MSTFQVYILAADCAFYEGPCESIVVPTMQGQYGILPHHSNMIGAVLPGEMSYRVPGKPVQFAAVFWVWVRERMQEGMNVRKYVDIDEPDDFQRLCELVFGILTNDVECFFAPAFNPVFSGFKTG